MEPQSVAKYEILGKVDTKSLKKLPQHAVLMAYAVGAKQVLGWARVDKKGNFKINYQHKVLGRKRQPYGINCVLGPKMPFDKVPNALLPKQFIKSSAFKKAGDGYAVSIQSEFAISQGLIDFIKNKYIEYCPCVFLVTCSGVDYIDDYPVCHDQEPLGYPNVYVRISEVWGTRFFYTMPFKKTLHPLVEGPVDENGYFSKCVMIELQTSSPILGPAFLGYHVEVFQVMGSDHYTLYTDDIEKPRSRFGLNPGYDLISGDCVRVCVDRSTVDLFDPEEADPPIPGRTLRFARIARIPREYIEADGRADTSSAPASSPVLEGIHDSAFSGRLYVYANIGEDLLNDATRESEVAYFRIKYSYHDGVNDQTGYLTRRFRNPRYVHNPDGSVGDPVYEDLGPLPLSSTGDLEGMYIYPNPHERIDLHPDRDWYFKELLTIINTNLLPCDYALYTFELELYNSDMTRIDDIVDPDGTGLSMNLLVDNVAPTGEIFNIMGPGDQVATACGFIELPEGGVRPQVCNGVAQSRVHSLVSNISVPFAVLDTHGNLHSLRLHAHWGCDESVKLAGGTLKPETSDNLQEYAQYTDVPAAERPEWSGRNDYSASLSRQWDQCAYQFRLRVWKRVTNGMDPHSIEREFTKHITILAN